MSDLLHPITKAAIERWNECPPELHSFMMVENALDELLRVEPPVISSDALSRLQVLTSLLADGFLQNGQFDESKMLRSTARKVSEAKSNGSSKNATRAVAQQLDFVVSIFKNRVNEPNIDALLLYTMFIGHAGYNKAIDIHQILPNSEPSDEYVYKIRRASYKKAFSRLNIMETKDLFQRLKSYGLYEMVEEKMLDKVQNPFPREITDKFRKWNAKQEQAIEAISSPKIQRVQNADKIVTPDPAPPALAVVIVPGLLPHGDIIGGEETLAKDYSNAGGEYYDEPQIQQKTSAIERAILASSHLDLDKCFIYENPVAVTDRTGTLYKVIQTETQDGNITQIAVCDRKGRATYAWKTPIDFTEAGSSITIRDLREDLTVQSRRCGDLDHFQTNIMSIVHAEQADLPLQTKTPINWVLRGEQLLNSVAYFVLDHQRLPTARDGIVEHGETRRGSLYKKTTWELADRALKQQPGRSVIPGFEDIKSLDGLGEKVLAAYPVLKDFLSASPAELELTT